MFRLFGSLSLLWKVGIILGLLAGAVGAFKLWEHSIYQRGFDEATRACQDRVKKQQQLVEEVKAEAERDQAALEEAIRMLERDNANVLTQIDEATAADPLGGGACLSADSVSRLNSIR